MDGASSDAAADAVVMSAVELCRQQPRQWCLGGMLEDPQRGLTHVRQVKFSESPLGIAESRSPDPSPHEVLQPVGAERLAAFTVRVPTIAGFASRGHLERS